VLTKTIQESVGTSAYKNDCDRCGHPLFGGVGYPRGKIPLRCVDTFGRSTSLQDVIIISAPPPQKKGQADCGYALAGNGVLAVFSLLILLLDAKVRVNGTKQRALLINALRLDENFCRLVQFCFPRWSDAVSTTSASEYDAI